MSYLGELLTARREELGKTLEDAARYTSIRATYLEHLERGEYEKLPSYVHVHGFLAQYCKYLGLDFAEKVKPLLNDECKKETFGKTPEEIKIEVVHQSDPAPIHAGQVIAVAVLVVIVAVAFIFFKVNGISSKRTAAQNVAEEAQERPAYTSYGNGNSAAAQTVSSPTVNQTPAAQTTVAAPTPSAAAETSSANTAPAANVEKTAILKFSADCWMQYRVDSLNSSLGEFTAPGGTEYSITFTKFFQLNVGNAGGLTVIYNGVSYSDFGAMSAVAFNLYFTVDETGSLQRSRTPPTF